MSLSSSVIGLVLRLHQLDRGVEDQPRAWMANSASRSTDVAADLLGDEQAVGAGDRIGGQLTHLLVGQSPGAMSRMLRLRARANAWSRTWRNISRARGSTGRRSSASIRPEAQEVGGVQQRLGRPASPARSGGPRGSAVVGSSTPCSQLREAALDHRGDQVVLVFEVPVDRAGRQSALLADQRDAGALVATLGGDLGGRVQDSFAGLLAVGPRAAGGLLAASSSAIVSLPALDSVVITTLP